MFGAAFTSIQRLTILEQTQKRLILREHPRLEWLLALAAFLGVVIPLAINLYTTAALTLAVAIFIFSQARTRIITFDAETSQMSIIMHSLLGKKLANEMPLAAIEKAYLRRDENGSTQIILVTSHGETGLSVYSKDVTDWKMPIIDAVNQILQTQNASKGA